MRDSCYSVSRITRDDYCSPPFTSRRTDLSDAGDEMATIAAWNVRGMAAATGKNGEMLHKPQQLRKDLCALAAGAVVQKGGDRQ